MFCYDSTTRWNQFPATISREKSHFAATVSDGQNMIMYNIIIIVGGYTSVYPRTTKTDKVEMFDWSIQTCKTSPPMYIAGHSMAELNGILYIAGEREFLNDGSKKARREYRVWRYSFESNQWSDVKLPNFPTEYNHLIPYENHLYALGTFRFEKYDSESDQWTVLTPPKTDSAHMAATLHQDKFYVCSFDGFEVYDSETNHWTSLPAPAVESYTSLMSVNGKLLTVGERLASSRNDRSETDLIYEFDLRTKQWKEFGKLPLKLSYHQGVVGQFH